MDAVTRWNRALADWALPAALLAAAPESPYSYSVALFDRRAQEAAGRDTPSRRRGREALADGGTVLDVGCGAGAASLALAPPAGRLVGVDEQEEMLAAFAARAHALGVDHAEVHGRWPDVAAAVPEADVVVCHHVLYNVGDLEPFVQALDAHARRRVVVEITAEHPLAWLRPLWQRLHGLDRPTRPTADDAIAALRALGLAVQAEGWQHTPAWQSHEDHLVAFVRQRLCLPAERDADVRAALEATGIPRTRDLVTLWWAPG